MLGTAGFIPGLPKAVVFAFGKAHDRGHTSTVNCLKIRQQTQHGGKLHVEGNPFRLLDKGWYIWTNENIRKNDLEEGSIVTVGAESNWYLGNTGTKMDLKEFLSQLKFGQGNHGIAYRGVEEAFPYAKIALKGICQENWKPGTPYALISVFAGLTADDRVHIVTHLGEEINLKNRSCGDYKESGVRLVSLPVEEPSSDDDVGNVILVSFGRPTSQGKYLAVCEGILLNSSSNWRKEEPMELSHYPMRRNGGVCLIINNLCFRNKDEDRYGGEHDENVLVELFDRELGFEVHVRNDLRSHQMLEVVEEIASMDHDDCDAFFCFIMSHGGDRDTIVGVKGRKVGIEELMAEFKSAKCPSLSNKPKVFIIQACRGELQDNGMQSTSESSSTDSTVAGYSTDSTLCRTISPQESDFLLAFSTAPGYVSYREPEFGTPFIQTFVEVIRKDRRKEHLLDMLTTVNRLVAERGQVPAPVSTLRYKLYL